MNNNKKRKLNHDSKNHTNDDSKKFDGPWSGNDDVVLQMYESELKKFCHPDYIYRRFRDVLNERKRVYTWIQSIGEKYKFRPATVQLSFSITERFLAKVQILPDCATYELLALSALGIAFTFMETALSGFDEIVEVELESKDFVIMKNTILMTLDYSVLSPTPLLWFHIFMKRMLQYAENYQSDLFASASSPVIIRTKSTFELFKERITTSSFYSICSSYIDKWLIENNSRLYLPSHLTAAAIFYSTSDEPLQFIIINVSGYTREQLKVLIASFEVDSSSSSSVS